MLWRSHKKTLFAFAAVVALSLLTLAQSLEDSSALLQAAFKGETSVVKHAIANGADPNQKDKDGKSLLTYAVIGGHKDTVAALLSLGSKPNSDDGGALLSACLENRMDIACMLVEAGANVNLVSGDKYGRAPLHEACRNDNLELARYLLDHGADPNLADHEYLFGWTPLMLAAQSDAELTALLLERGAKVDQRSYTGYTALWLASRVGKVETAKALLAAGAEVDARDTRDGATPLYQAAVGGHADVVKLLLKAGADPNARATKRLDTTPLMAASRCGSLESVNALLSSGADPKASDTEGHTALMYAAIAAKEDVLVALLKAGALVNAKDGKGETALFAAYQSANPDAIRTLIHLGADPSIKDVEGKQAADYAPQQKKLLLNNNPKVPEKDGLEKEVIVPAPR
jgi:ankyrin repeat protein